MARLRTFLVSLACLLTALVAPPGARADEDKFGEVSFPISCSATAQQQFDRAVAMLHSFHPEAVKVFGAIAREEPSCAMAWWGVAVGQRPNPLVGPFPGNVLKAGWEAIEKARAANPKTERESGWIEALAAIYQDYERVPQRTRTSNYEAAMARLHGRHPDDAEIAIFYALALNEAADPADKTYAKPLKAAAILEKLEPRHPNHPGIPHYLIHSYDFPELAIRGVIAANRCTQLAPSAPHALHMPSHIYATLGMWEEVIRTELVADEMIQRYVARVDPAVAADQGRNPLRYHSLDFLAHAYLQLAQDQKARAILGIRDSFGGSGFPAGMRYSMHTAYAAIPVRYAFERGAWSEAAALPVARTIYPQAEAISWFARAVGAARTGDAAAAREAAARLRVLKGKLAQDYDEYWAGQVDIQETAAMAWIALREGRKEEAIRLMRRAADLEDNSGKHVAMENRLSPMREMLGELLLEANEPARALSEFEASLRNNPNRYRSYAGAAKAAEMLGKDAVARGYSERLLTLAGSADSERPDLIAARRRLASK